ncbi:MAG: hypothetical protein N2Z82_09145 [Thermomicrobium sp.]|nr:hypothetical protein [Thermomicrobium sp.]
MRTALLGGLALAFLPVAVWFAVVAGAWVERLFAISMAIFLIFAGLLTLLAAFDRTPVLELDPEGLIDRASFVHAGRISWRDVRRVEAHTTRGRRLLVHVYRPQRFAAALDPVRRRAAEELIERYGTPIVIAWDALDQPLDRVVEVAESLRRAALAREAGDERGPAGA